MDKDKEGSNIELSEFRSPRTSNVDDEIKELSTVYNSINSNLARQNTLEDSYLVNSDLEDENLIINKPLIDDGIRVDPVNDEIQLERINNYGEGSPGETGGLLIQETNIDGLGVGPDEDINIIRRTTGPGLSVRVLKPTPAKLGCLGVFTAILFLVVFLPSCIYRLEYNKVKLHF